jgi:quercetin dioxygenase-like cupin family protein
MDVKDITERSNLVPIDPQPIPKIEFHLADDVMVKLVCMDKGGYLVEGHKHNYDHTSFLFSGSFRMWKDGNLDRDYHAPCGVLVEKGVVHSMLTLEDNTNWGCIHNTHGFPADELEEHLVMKD